MVHVIYTVDTGRLSSVYVFADLDDALAFEKLAVSRFGVENVMRDEQVILDGDDAADIIEAFREDAA